MNNDNRSKEVFKIGSGKGQWFVHNCARKYLHVDSVIYSFGIGTDISFDLELIDIFGSRVFGFDPTPYAIEWIGQQTDISTNFNFYPWGIDSEDRVGKLYPPSKKGLSSYSVLERDSFDNRQPVYVLFKRISIIMKQLKHDTIDILKLDIEGAEYRVLRDMIKSQIYPKQILVEFHHHNSPLCIDDTYYAIDLVCSNGYRLVHISERGREFLFIKSDLRNDK